MGEVEWCIRELIHLVICRACRVKIEDILAVAILLRVDQCVLCVCLFMHVYANAVSFNFLYQSQPSDHREAA